MADFSKIQVQLEAESAKLTKELEKVNTKLSKFERGAKKSLDGFSTAAKAAFGVLSVAAVTNATRNALDFADGIDKAAKAAGVSATFLQELRFAADQNGVSFRGLDDSVRRFNRRLGEFLKSGGGPAKKAFEELNIATRDLEGNARSTEDVFADVVVAIDGLSTTAEKSAAAAQLFGDDFGPKLVTLLDQGIVGIEQLREAARSSGQVMNEEVIANAVAAKDAMAQLSGQFTVAANSIILQLAPTLEGLAKFLGQNLPGAIDATGEAFNVLRFALLKGAEGFATFLSSVAGYYATIAEFVGADEIGQSLRNVQQNYEDIAGNIDDLNAAYISARVEAEKFNAEAGKNPYQALENQSRGLGAGDQLAADEAAEAAAKAAEEEKKRLEELAEEQRKYNEELDAAAKAIQEQVNPIQALGDELAKLDELLATGRISWETYGEAVFQAQESFEELDEKAKDATDEISTYADEAARNIQDSFAQFLFDPFDQGIEGMLDGFVVMLRQMAAEAAATQILEGLGESSAFSGFFSFLGLGGARAMGGPVTAGVPYLVGERNKPEIFVPNTSGNILPSVGGTNNINVSVNVAGGGDQSRESMNQIGLSVARAIQKAQKRIG